MMTAGHGPFGVVQPVDVESCDFVYHAELRVEHPHPHERDCHERSDGRHVEQTSEGVFAFDEFGAEQQGQAETKHNAEECGTPANTAVFPMEVQKSLSVRICLKLSSPTQS